jgi:hypothetical protein
VTLLAVFTRSGTDHRTVGRRRGVDDRASWHLHWFRWLRDDPFSGSSLYGCRCGLVRPGL